MSIWSLASALPGPQDPTGWWALCGENHYPRMEWRASHCADWLNSPTAAPATWMTPGRYCTLGPRVGIRTPPCLCHCWALHCKLLSHPMWVIVPHGKRTVGHRGVLGERGVRSVKDASQRRRCRRASNHDADATSRLGHKVA